MRKTINFVPIYRGELNMTPDRYQEIESAKIYIDTKGRKKFWKVVNTVECIIISVSSSYLVISILRGIIR